MRNKMRKVYVVILIATFIFVACTKEEAIVSKPDLSNDVTFEVTDYNLDMRDFAMAINEAINSNQSFKNLIRDEVNKCFDGDYNVLLTMIVDKEVNNYKVGQDGRMMVTGGNISVRELLNSSFENIKTESAIRNTPSMSIRNNTEGLSLVDKLTKKYPYLQVAVPFHPEHLKNDKYIPPVVFLPEEYSEDKTEFLQAFKRNKEFTINAKLIPDSACVVIDMNERISVLRKFNEPPIAPTSLTVELTDYGIVLNWSYSYGFLSNSVSLVENGYKIYRKENNGKYELIYQNSSFLNNSYVDMNVNPRKKYYYYIVAYNNIGESRPVFYRGGVEFPKRPAAAKSFEVNPTGLNKSRIRWNFDDSENYGTLKIYKREEGEDYSKPFFIGQLPIDGDEYVDYNAKAGSRLEYRIERTYNGVTSAPKYDLVYMPYRDVTKKSSVYIKGVKCDDVNKIESWRGAPEYLMKCYRAKKIGSDFVGTEAFTIMVYCDNHTNNWEYVNKLLTTNWQPGFDGAEWYDVLSFNIVEYDGHELFSNGMNGSISNVAKAFLKLYPQNSKVMQNNSPNNAFPWAAVVMTAIEVGLEIPKWVTSDDDVIGYVHLSYFDDPNSVFTIPVACADTEFSIQFSDKR